MSINNFFLSSLLFDAIDDQDLKSMKTLLDKGANPNLILSEREISPFHFITGVDPLKFAIDGVALLLKYGGNPNVQSDEGLTPVHIAAAWGRLEILKMLLLAGGDPEILDDDYHTPIHCAKINNHPECLEILEEFLPNKGEFMNRTNDNKPHYKLTLDRIIVNIIRDDYDDNSLKKLPIKNNEEYILNWCQNNEESFKNVVNNKECENNNFLIKPIEIPKIRINDYDINKNWTFKSSISDSQNFSLDDTSMSLDENKNDDDETKQFSLESGVENLPETSSDYITCCSNDSTVNILEKNIFHIDNTVNNDNSKNYDILSVQQSDTDDASFCSIEVYKYVDDEEKIVLIENRFVKTSTCESNKSSGPSISNSYDTDSLKRELTLLGYNPGPITKTTKRVYLKKLNDIQKSHKMTTIINETTNAPLQLQLLKKEYSWELEKSIKNPNWFNENLNIMRQLEENILKQFNNNDTSRKWREGNTKSSFTYLLLDPTITNNLPLRSDNLNKSDIWKIFLKSIFYIGKGKRSRPYSHLYEAVNLWQNGIHNSNNKKLKKILKIWSNGYGVICLQVFQNIIPVEAYTREAAMICALKIDNLCNLKYGDFYGNSTVWSLNEKRLFGIYLLQKAMNIYLIEGERQIKPENID